MEIGGEGDYIPIATLSSQEWLLHQDGQRWDYISNFLSLVLSVLDDIDRADCTQPSKVTEILSVSETRKVLLLGVAHHQKITLYSPKDHLLTCICYSSVLTFFGICEWIQLRACAGKKAGEREKKRESDLSECEIREIVSRAIISVSKCPFAQVFMVIPPWLSGPGNFITTLLVTQEPEQMMHLFRSTACSMASHSFT